MLSYTSDVDPQTGKEREVYPPGEKGKEPSSGFNLSKLVIESSYGTPNAELLQQSATIVANNQRSIGLAYLDIPKDQEFPIEETDDDSKKLYVDSNIFGRYQHALNIYSKNKKFKFDISHYYGKGDTARKGGISKVEDFAATYGPSEGYMKAHSTEVTSSNWATQASIMMILASERQRMARFVCNYPLCLFVGTQLPAKSYNVKFPLSLRRYKMIVFSANNYKNVDGVNLAWVAFGIMENDNYWYKKGPFIKVFHNSVGDDVNIAKEIGNDVKVRWNNIVNSFYEKKLFLEKTININRTSSNIINEAELIGNDDSYVPGRTYTDIQDQNPQSLMWVINQLSMTQDPNIFFKNDSSRIYVKQAITDQEQLSRFARTLKKESSGSSKKKEPEVENSNVNIWVNGIISMASIPYVSHNVNEDLATTRKYVTRGDRNITYRSEDHKTHFPYKQYTQILENVTIGPERKEDFKG